MGRKKFEIEFIEDESNRKSMFKNRIGGVLKKLHDLTVLCGLKTCLVFTDTESNIHTFTNTN